MLFMPFQVLGVWLRGLFALGLLALGGYLLHQWYDHRETYVEEVPAREVPRPGPDDADRGANSPRELPPEEAPGRRVVRWQFGLNKETAFLLGGAGLLAFSLGGGLLAGPLLRRRGGRPTQMHGGEARQLRRPDGSELHVELFGPEDGVPVVLTHGWGLDSREWDYAKEELGGRFRLIAWDLPGLGKSGRPADNDWSLERLARDLEAVLGLAGGRPAVLAGHSIGGMIILTFCRLFPEALGGRVCGLALAQSTYTNPVKTTSTAWLYTALEKPVLEPLCHLTVWLSPLVWLMNLLSYLNGSAHRSTERVSFSGREGRGQLDFMARYYLTAWPGVVGRGMLAMFRYDATGVLATIPVPALVVAGDGDTTCTPEASAYMARHIPQAELMTLPSSRHCGLFEHHQDFHARLAEFVAACGR